MSIWLDSTPPTGLFTTRPLAYAGALIVVILSVGLAFPLHQWMPHANLSLLFLTGILIVSARTGLGPSLVASVLSFLAFNFFFTPPFYTFEVADDGDVATLIFFLIMAAITGNLAARMHQEMLKRRLSLQHTANLYDFSQQMASAANSEEVLDKLVRHFSYLLNTPVAVYLPDEADILTRRAATSPAIQPPVEEIAHIWSGGKSDPGKLGQWFVLPLVTDQQPVGLLVMPDHPLDSEQLALSRSLCQQAAIALDRTRLVADLEQVRLVSETEQLRSALLSSVSHDLRTPLASIIGSTTSLLEYGDSISGQNRTELLKTVVEEAQRLDRHIQNLLDMTRLGQGNLSLHRDWVDLHDIVSSAVERLGDRLQACPLKIAIDPEVPLLRVHGVLIEQALVNLLDNAVRFSPPGGEITLTARLIDDQLEILLCDQGPGIPADQREKIFDMFYTARQGDRADRPGTGLGLAIVRGMIAAHGGTVTARDGASGRGTCMQIRLAVDDPEESEA